MALHGTVVGRWLLGLATAAVVSAGTAGVALAVPARHPETRLLWAAAAFVLAATLVCAVWDRQPQRMFWLKRNRFFGSY